MRQLSGTKRKGLTNMQAQAYEGYFEDGLFYTADQTIRIPERRQVYITVIDEPIADSGFMRFEISTPSPSCSKTASSKDLR